MAMWAPNLTGLTIAHWYFGALVFNEMLKAITEEKKKFLHDTPCIDFYIVFTCMTSYDIDWMISLTLEKAKDKN